MNKFIKRKFSLISVALLVVGLIVGSITTTATAVPITVITKNNDTVSVNLSILKNSETVNLAEKVELRKDDNIELQQKTLYHRKKNHLQ